MNNILRSTRRALFIPALLIAAAACGDDSDPVVPEITDDIIDIATSTPDVSTLAAAIEAAGLIETLRRQDLTFTVFAPVNSAFAALGDDVISNLLDPANIDLLTGILTFHVVPGAAATAGELADGQMLSTVQGERLTVGLDGDGVTVNGARVISADIEASNGIIHLIDGVLLPELDIVDRAIVTPQTQLLAAAVGAADLASFLRGIGPFTVFAPVDAAFEALGTDKLDVLLDPSNWPLLQKVLTYHVIGGDIRAADLSDGAVVTTLEGSDVIIDLSGDTPRVNGANIIATDIVTSNGVIHLIDGVLTDNLDIVDQAVVNGFSTLVGAVQGAGLEATLRSDNSGAGFTVFAPTNEAFAALAAIPAGDALVSVLTYHVVGAMVGSGDLSDGQVVTTVEGTPFTVNIGMDGVSLTDATGQTVRVLITDVPAANGVIHVLDGVILPSG